MPNPEKSPLERLEHNFVYHAPKNDQARRYETLRAYALSHAKVILEMTPTSREQSLAFTKLEEVVFWANAAIARNE
jgi:hypothetical protein